MQVDLFPEPARDQKARLFPQHPSLERERTQENTARLERFPKPWTGSGKYNRVGEIGKGAFATVYKVTTTFGGIPFAAKELDKRKFMKNGILDQKVENEMKIMQKVQHVRLPPYKPLSLLLGSRPLIPPSSPILCGMSTTSTGRIDFLLSSWSTCKGEI